MNAKILLLAGLVLAPTVLPASAAVETVLVGEVEATRVVIAPPRSDLATAIRDDLRAALDAAPQGSRAYEDARQLYYLYGSRYFEPLWLAEGKTGGLVFSPAATAILEIFAEAHLEGLDPTDYRLSVSSLSALPADAAGRAALEAEFSAALLAYAQDAWSGRLDPRSISPDLDIDVKRVDAAALFAELAGGADPATTLERLHPTHREFAALRTLLAAHHAGAVAERPTLPEGPVLRPGMADRRVPVLRRLLEIAPPPELSAAELYDEALRLAVTEFQRAQGLSVDGIVGPATVAALNGAGGASRAEIVANMERWRWMPRELGEFNVFVNIPEYRLEVQRRGEVIWDSRVVVGTPARQTPIFSDRIRHVVTNPFWNLPPTILREDVLPRARANPGYFASQDMEVLFQGRVIDPFIVDWRHADPRQFRVRQRPGRSNALGQVKFLFPNHHDVYLHDTNAPNLFSRSVRALSSGCIRVENPFEFARVLLEGEPNFTIASVENSLGPTERWFNMDHRVPVHLAYFTLRVGERGETRSFADVYGHNRAVIEALGLAAE